MSARQASPISIGRLRPAVLGLGRAVSIGLTSVAAAPLAARDHGGEAETRAIGNQVWILAVASLALTLIGGVFAGLTIASVFFILEATRTPANDDTA